MLAVNPIEEIELQEMKKVEKNTDKEQFFPKNQTYMKPQTKESVILLRESSKMNEKDARPTYSNDVLGMMF